MTLDYSELSLLNSIKQKVDAGETVERAAIATGSQWLREAINNEYPNAPESVVDFACALFEEASKTQEPGAIQLTTAAMKRSLKKLCPQWIARARLAP